MKTTKQQSKTKSGFTIIEVVLVLAIAGLIFLMVFVALPALQRSQRDTQRRNDYSALSTAVTNWMTNHNGSLPISSGKCNSSFTAASQMNNSGVDPDGTNYTLTCQQGGTAPSAPSASTVYVIGGMICSGGTPTTTGAGSRDFAVYGGLESGTYCVSSK